MIDNLKDRSVLILGFGREGKDTLSFLQSRFPGKIIGVADKQKKSIKKENIKTYFGEKYLESLSGYEVIIKSPGVSFDLIKDKVSDKIVTSQTDIFLSERSSDTIGVTGTKGKSTTCLCIYNILKKELDKDVYLLGNIGQPVLNYIDKEGVFVYELSSFQLQTASKSPHLAVFLNLYRDHLDQHVSFEEYVSAKTNIFKHQSKSDILVYNEDDPEVLKLIDKSKSRKIPFDPKYKIPGTPIYLDPILKVAELFNVSRENSVNCVEETDFLPHRMEKCGNYKGIKFINDSAATIPEAAVKAIDSLEDLKTLITGGVDKGGDYDKLAKKIAESGIETLILFPDTGEKIKEELKKITDDLPLIIDSDSMEDAVKSAYEKTNQGSCLMSPASSSFNMFFSYKDRGDKFKKFVKKYGEK